MDLHRRSVHLQGILFARFFDPSTRTIPRVPPFDVSKEDRFRAQVVRTRRDATREKRHPESWRTESNVAFPSIEVLSIFALERNDRKLDFQRKGNVARSIVGSGSDSRLVETYVSEENANPSFQRPRACRRFLSCDDSASTIPTKDLA